MNLPAVDGNSGAGASRPLPDGDGGAGADRPLPDGDGGAGAGRQPPDGHGGAGAGRQRPHGDGEAAAARRLDSCARAWAAVWLCYDVIDLLGGGTAAALAGGAAPRLLLIAAQLTLAGAEALLVLRGRSQVRALTCFAARAVEAWLFGLNDFYCCCVVALHLACEPPRRGGSVRLQQALLWQLAWIYAATAVLKLQPAWLSGGILYARQNYQAAAFGWPYPAFYTRCIATLPCNAALAAVGVGGELVLAGLMWECARRTGEANKPIKTTESPPRTWPNHAAIILATCIHTFAALATNVWFFSASMLALVTTLTYPHRRPQAYSASGTRPGT